MVKITLEIPEELSEKLEKLGDRLPEVLSQSLDKITLPSYIYRYVLNFLASNPNHQQISEFQPSAEMQDRLSALIMGSKAGTLAPNELSELDEYERIEHLIVMLKAGNLRFLQA